MRFYYLIKNNIFLLANFVSILRRRKIVQKQPPDVFCKKGVLKNFAKLSGQHLSQSLLFNKVAGLSYQLYLKKISHKCLPVNSAQFLRTPFYTEHLRWLLLKVKNFPLTRTNTCTDTCFFLPTIRLIFHSLC